MSAKILDYPTEEVEFADEAAVEALAAVAEETVETAQCMRPSIRRNFNGVFPELVAWIASLPEGKGGRFILACPVLENMEGSDTQSDKGRADAATRFVNWWLCHS